MQRTKPFQYGTNLGNNTIHLNPNTIVLHEGFSAFEIKFGTDTTPVDRSRKKFTPTGEPPGEYLRRNGVDVANYVSLYAFDKEYTGRPPSDLTGPDKDPYWLELEMAKAADKYGFWLICNDTNQRPTGMKWGGEPIYPLNVASSDFRDWFVDTVTRNRGPRTTLRFDMGWDGQSFEVYIKCRLCRQNNCRPGSASPNELTQGQYDLYDDLRREGWRVIVNNGWFMDDPTVPAEQWTYPLMPHVDGIMVEAAGAVYVYDKNGDGHWIGENHQRRRAIAEAWSNAGKVMLYSAQYNLNNTKFANLYGTEFPEFSSWEDFVIGDAKHYGYRATITNGAYAIWKPKYGDEKPAPLFPEHHKPKTLAEISIAAAKRNHCIRIYEEASLYKQIISDGFVPTSNEYKFIDEETGDEYVGQRAQPQHSRPDRTLLPRAYRCPVTDYNAIEFDEIENA